MKPLTLFIVLTVFIIITSVFVKRKSEHFALNIINSKCSDYIEKSLGIKWDSYTPEQQSVIGDLLRATVSSDTVDGTISDDIGGCVFPTKTLPQYSIGDPSSDDACSFKDGNGNDIMPQGTTLTPVGQNTINSSLEQDGCMLQFSNDLLPGSINFTDIIKKAYTNKEYPTAKQIEEAQKRIDLLNRETTNLISNNKAKTDQWNAYLSENNSLQTNISSINTNIDNNNQQIATNSQQIAQINQNIEDNRQNRVNLLQNAQVRLVKETKYSNKPIIQKRMSDGNWYTLIMKYTYGMSKQTNFNNDPWFLYNKAYGKNINIDTVTNSSPDAFINDNLLQYRNDWMLFVLAGLQNGTIPGSSRVVIEVYNDTSMERLAAIEFMLTKNNDYNNWWNASNLQTSDGKSETTITSLISDAKNNNFWGGPWGDDNLQRRFFINRGYLGCPNDPGYIGIPYRGDMSWCWDTSYRGKILIAKESYFNFGGNGMSPNQISRYHLGTKMLMWMRKDQGDPYQNISTSGSIQLLNQINYSIPMNNSADSVEIVGNAVAINPDVIVVPGKNIPFGNGDYSWSFWLRIDGVENYWRNVFIWGDSDYHRGPACFINPNTHNMHFRQTTDHDYNEGLDNLTGPDWGIWGFLTFTLQSNILTGYLNGNKTGQIQLIGNPLNFKNENLHVGSPFGYTFDNKVSIAYLNMFPYVISQQDMQNTINNTQKNLSNDTTPIATLYVDCNYSGLAVTINPGDYSWIVSLGFPNDALSSLTIPSGYQIILYQDANFAGNSITVTGNISCLIDQGFNDVTSSLRFSKQ